MAVITRWAPSFTFLHLSNYFSLNLTSDKEAESQAVVKQVGRDVHILSCDHPHCQSQVHPRLEDLVLVIIYWLLSSLGSKQALFVKYLLQRKTVEIQS